MVRDLFLFQRIASRNRLCCPLSILFFSDDGQAFVCQPGEKSFSPMKVVSRRKPSVSSTSSDTALAQSPPNTTPLSNLSDDKDTCTTLTKSFSDSSLLRLLVKENCKKEALWYCLERIPFIHRGLRVFTDSKSKGFAVLQISAREGYVFSSLLVLKLAILRNVWFTSTSLTWWSWRETCMSHMLSVRTRLKLPHA